MSRSALRLLIATIFLTANAYPTLAQFGRSTAFGAQIHGQVRYAQGGAPADKVFVRLERNTGGIIDEVFTDQTGKFRFSNVQRDQYTVHIHAPGYHDIREDVELKTTLSQYLTFSLVPDESEPKPANSSSNTGGVLNAKVPVEAQEEFTKARAAIMTNGNMQEGIHHLEKAVKIFPSFMEAHLMLGTAYMDTHQWERAETALRHALALNPKRIEPLLALGALYRQQKKYPEAEKSLLSALKIEANSWQGHYTLGGVYWEMGKIGQAGPHVGRALQLKPDLAEGYLLGGDILLRSRQPENALIEYEEYLRLAPAGKFALQTRELVAKIKRAIAEQRK
jgi:Tfp pilus assembly protein PilF